MRHRFPQGIPKHLRKQCEVCRAQGQALTSHCKGKPLTDMESLAVRAKVLDFVNDTWIIPDPQTYYKFKSKILKGKR